MSGRALHALLRVLARLFAFALIALAAFVLAGLVLRPAFPDGLPTGPDGLGVISMMFTASLLLAHAAVVLLFERGRWDATGLGAGGWRPLALLLGVVVGATGILVPALVLAVAESLTFVPAEPGPVGAALLDALVLLAAPALMEELLTRGYALGVIARQYGEAPAIAVTSLGFGLLHLANPGASAGAVSAVVVAGVFLSAVRLTTGSLAAAWLAHLAINWTQGAVLHAPISGLAFLPTPHYRAEVSGPGWLTGGAWGLEAGAVTAATLLVVTFLLFWARPATAGTRDR
jgi:uncharacterized protein